MARAKMCQAISNKDSCPMDILVSGSLAYDRIMDYSGRFADHLMPD